MQARSSKIAEHTLSCMVFTHSCMAPRLRLGYGFVWANFSEYAIEGQELVWAKMTIMSQAFQKFPDAQWLWWLDFDALIMTPSIELGTHLLNHDVMNTKISRGVPFYLRFLKSGRRPKIYNIPEDFDAEDVNMIVSTDRNGINAGSLFLQRGLWSEMLLDLWYDPLFIEKEWYGMEQDALVHILTYHESFTKHVGFVDQKHVNSYSSGAVSGHWTPGDLVIHLAGCR
jgi:galactosyl transferase GMA12/MNN10 family